MGNRLLLGAMIRRCRYGRQDDCWSGMSLHVPLLIDVSRSTSERLYTWGGRSKMADIVGQQLGKYRLLRQLGQGGFAEVYLGEHIYLKTRAAIKVLKLRLANDDRESFFTEARTIASLKHPNIVRVIDFGVEDDRPFLVMDYAPSNLRQLH